MTAPLAPVAKFAMPGKLDGPAAPAPDLSKTEIKQIEKEESKFHEFVVTLDDQASREVEKAFTMPTGLERRQYVAKTLHDNMVKTQAPLWKVLDGLQAAGHVSARRSYTPLWIQNSIVVYGDDDAMAVMSSAAGVAQAVESAQHTVESGAPGEPFAGIDSAVGGAAAIADAPVSGGSMSDHGPDDQFWGLTRTQVAKANADGLTGKGVVVGVLDTGFDVTHPFLLGKYRGYDAESGSRSDTGNWYDSTPEKSSEPVDVGRHGTFVSGEIGGSYGGVQTGVAPDVKFVAARGLGEEGGSDGMLLSSFQNMIAPKIPTPGTSPGFERDLSYGPDLINNSWGSDDGTSTTYQNALRNMDAMGIVNFFAAGNDGEAGRGTVGSPGSSPNIITVAATNPDDTTASFSSRGPNPLPVPDGEPVPFIAMPGTFSRSTIPGGAIEAGWQGTSMATPLATGFGALADQAALELTGHTLDTRAMKEVLRRSAQDVGLKGVDDETGYGIPVAGNLRKVVAAVAKDLALPGYTAAKGAKAAK